MTKKRPKISLGQAIQPRKGDLEKLFTTEGDVEQAPGLQLLSIRLDAILPDPSQPRRTFPEDSLQELSESIRQDGVIQPIEVTEMGPNQYMIVHGERRWKAAEMAGLESIPAVVRRQDYDTTTRLVRQLVENIQREDLNDVDRAAGLLRLREMLQTELDTRVPEDDEEASVTPWAKTITWAKVGNRLGYSRQRIHQLIQLLDLPEAIKEDVRTGKLSERDTRIYQGLNPKQQRDLHKARYDQSLTHTEIRLVGRSLKKDPIKSVSQAIQEMRQPPPVTDIEQPVETSFDYPIDPTVRNEDESSIGILGAQPWIEESALLPRQTGTDNLDLLRWIRKHLASLQRPGISPAERRETVRLLELIQQDVASLLAAFREDESFEE